MASYVNEVLTMKVLALKHRSQSLEDMVDLGMMPESQEMRIKNVCAKLPEALSDEIDAMCAVLGLRKRTFIEAALITALDEANKLLEEHDIRDHHGVAVREPAQVKVETYPK